MPDIFRLRLERTDEVQLSGDTICNQASQGIYQDILTLVSPTREEWPIFRMIARSEFTAPCLIGGRYVKTGGGTTSIFALT